MNGKGKQRLVSIVQKFFASATVVAAFCSSQRVVRLLEMDERTFT
jgi:hypothetical protein